MITDQNKDINGAATKGVISQITYNHLNLPENVHKKTSEYLLFTYDATGRKLRAEVFDTKNKLTSKTDYLGEFIYEDDALKFINTEEGRVIINGASLEYQYFLKDHLGNVRTTFTAKEDVEQSLATLETVNASSEQSQFLYYDEAILLNHELFDHTYDGTIGQTYYSTRLTGGNTNAIYGLAKSLSVMPGDIIEMEVYAKYLDPNSSNWTPALTSFMTAVAGGTAPTGTVVDGGSAGSIGSGTFPYSGVFDHSNETGAAPKAYLNFIVFDREFNPIIGESGFIRITSNAMENGNNVAHDKLQRTGPLVIKEPGYVYIYLSNENESPVEVYFDDFKVQHTKSPVVQMDDYYPFGLTFNSYQRENSVDQRWKFQGQEHIDDLGLNWDAFKWRNHQPDIGRFFNVDPIAEKYYYNSPYAFSENKVTAHVELEGLEAESIKKIWGGFKGLAEKATDKDTYTEIRRGFGQLGEKMGLRSLLFAKNLSREKPDNTPKDGDNVHIYSESTGPDEEYVPPPSSDSDTHYVDKSTIDAMAPKATAVPSAADVGESFKNVATAIDKASKAGKILKRVISENGSHVSLDVDSIRYSTHTKNYSYVGITKSGRDSTVQISKSANNDEEKK